MLNKTVFRRARNLKLISGFGRDEMAHEGCAEQEDSRRRQSDDDAGVHPIQPLPLVERDIQERESKAGVEETSPIRFGLPLLGLGHGLPWDTEINQDHHHRGEHGAVPKEPVPRQVVYVPRFQRSSEVGGKQNVHGIHRDAQQHVLHGKIAQDEGQGERVKGSCCQAREHQQDEHYGKVRSKGKHYADQGKQSRACQQDAPGAEQATKIYRKGPDEHHGGIERGVDP